jgi:hypothetical protein
MKNLIISGIISICVLPSCFAQDSKDAKNIPAVKYIAAKSFNSASSIPVVDINEFLTLITDYAVKHIFYTDTLFYFQAPQMAIPYTLVSNGYKKLADYQQGAVNFNNGASYYYAVENKLTNQAEVDYYRQEKYLKPEDFRDAQSKGFFKKGANNKRITKISGIVKRGDLQNRLPFANAIIYLMYLQQSDPVKSFLDNKDVDKFVVQFSVASAQNYRGSRYSGNVISEFKKGYFYINLDISGLGADKDAVLYYASKFANYADYDDFFANYNDGGQFTIKNSDMLSKELKYPSYQDFLTAINNQLSSGQM